MSSEYPKVGDILEKTAEVYELVIGDYVSLIDASESPFTSIDPVQYFVTSGDAIRKSEQLLKDITALTKKVVAYPDQDQVASLLDQCLKNIDGCKNMLEALIKARGTAIFMETEWGSEDGVGVLLVIPKNPRLKK